MLLSKWLSKVITSQKELEKIRLSEDRIVRAYKELLQGYIIDAKGILNEVERVENYSGIVKEEKIQFTSFCGHHFLPFFGEIDIWYEPRNSIAGLGKLPRLVQVLSARFQLQELLVKEIAEEINRYLQPKGVFVTSRAVHICMHSRGPKDRSVETICSYGLGSLENVYFRS